MKKNDHPQPDMLDVGLILEELKESHGVTVALLVGRATPELDRGTRLRCSVFVRSTEGQQGFLIAEPVEFEWPNVNHRSFDAAVVHALYALRERVEETRPSALLQALAS